MRVHENMTKKKPVEQLQKRGRKKIPIDLEKVENMAALMCSHEEIAAVMGISVSSLEHNPEFLQIHKKGMERGRASLRSFQFQLAKAGNPTMNIWLGKQYLGQSDRVQQEISGELKTTPGINAVLSPEAARKIGDIIAGNI